MPKVVEILQPMMIPSEMQPASTYAPSGFEFSPCGNEIPDTPMRPAGHNFAELMNSIIQQEQTDYR